VADFHQNVVPTFARLESEDIEGMERRIMKASVRTPIGVIIPALYTDLASPAMQQIVTQLANMPFLRRIYISLDRATGWHEVGAVGASFRLCGGRSRLAGQAEQRRGWCRILRP